MSDQKRTDVAKAVLAQTKVFLLPSESSGDITQSFITFPPYKPVQHTIEDALKQLGIAAIESERSEGMLAFNKHNTETLIASGIAHPVLEAAGGRIPAAFKR